MPSKLPLTSAVLFSLIASANAWTSRTGAAVRAPTCLKSSSAPSPSGAEDTCWQDIWNYDCAMSNIYSAAFVAGDWVKSMPCASGLVDCETPEELKLPGMASNGVEDVDVMDFLNLKRSKPLKKSE